MIIVVAYSLVISRLIGSFGHNNILEIFPASAVSKFDSSRALTTLLYTASDKLTFKMDYILYMFALSKRGYTVDMCIKVKSVYEPSGPSGRSLSRFLKHEATRSISTPPGWDTRPSQGYPQQ